MGYKGLQEDIGGYKSLQWVTWGYKGSQEVTGVRKGSYLYSRLRDGNGCAARTKEPECLMLSKYHTKFNIITKEMVYTYFYIKSLRLNYSRVPPDTKTQNHNGKKSGTYSPTNAVAQPLGVKGKKLIDR